ncbi:MAG: polysaccharide pyruvyl transferase CsaB [Cyanobacteria bacterium SZAS LIN-2]|nr:polysaccharide pyruvyl transferase CsaB [Cyanobacteria bacterium SZAS LIN-2]MBS2007190.1 polysaccharide pyruvyl transferase CsaB [Cyanobacteria bacterium SZAS TMP-1]
MARNLIIVSGYYGFDNLGDEAILEELLGELTEIASRDQIVVLSNAPDSTTQKFGVASANRWQLSEIMPLMRRAKLFISGGGGLFQDTGSAGSVIYYGGLICMAKALGTPTLVYAQGLGPLRRSVSQFCTRAVFNLADAITLRDDKSMAMLNQWGIKGSLTEDPVWLLKPGQLPETTAVQMKALRKDHKKLIGLSLREGGGFTPAHISELARSLDKTLPADAAVVGLPLQRQQDEPVLDQFAEDFRALGRVCHRPTLDDLTLPSQWLSLIGSLDMVVGMRLHSLIMALSSGVPVVGIAYDPKVARVLTQFEQPALAYTKGEEQLSGEKKDEWLKNLTAAVKETRTYRQKALEEAKRCKELACQNPLIIAKMLA